MRRLFPRPPAGETWIGDDAALVRSPSGLLVLTTDALVESVHFDLSLVGLDDLGWKAIAANVSDIAAVGGRPLHALLTVAGPPSTDLDLLARGVAEAAAEWGCAVVGGDLTNAPLIVVSVAMTGGIEGAPVLRAGARPGDVLWLTGPLGGSAAGLRALREGRPDDPNAARHRRPRARPAEGQTARRTGATAMVDVSDGLAADVGHLAAASGVGVALDDIPVAAGATEDDALGGGEDYELVFALPADAEPPEGSIRIGVCTGDPSERTLRAEPLPDAGWEHGFS